MALKEWQEDQQGEEDQQEAWQEPDGLWVAAEHEGELQLAPTPEAALKRNVWSYLDGEPRLVELRVDVGRLGGRHDGALLLLSGRVADDEDRTVGGDLGA